MAEYTIYHNPRCSKSRQTLALLRERGIDPKVIEYLRQVPDAETLTTILKKLRITPAELIRDKEYQSLGLPDTEDEQELIDRMIRHPEIIQRPIVVAGQRAEIGRPPERVLNLIEAGHEN